MDYDLKDYLKYLLFFIVIAGSAYGGFQLLRYTLKTQHPLMVVVSQSMVPTLGVGDFIFVDHIDDFEEVVAAPMPEGDIIVFSRSTSSSEYVVHRAIRSFYRGENLWFVTKGDHNPSEDSRPVPKEKVVGRVVGKIPVLGYFPLIIKTSRGFILVASLMAIVFFVDYIMPNKRSEEEGGRFPLMSIIPFAATPLVYLSFLFLSDSHLTLEIFALILWYIGCFIAPFAFKEDDTGLLIWLYHFVLAVVPLGCDIVWRTTGITPSMWWYGQGSTMPITWLLQKETPMFHRAFSQLSIMLLPGCALFMVLMAAKRKGVHKILVLKRWIRRSPSPL